MHPAADVFPMMSDAELDVLAKDIKANGLDVPIKFYFDRKGNVLIDGRNRLEAMERAGIELRDWEAVCIGCAPLNPVPHIISLNIKRRHLTKEQQADLIVKAVAATDKAEEAAAKAEAAKIAKLVQPEPVSKGGRGKINKVKAAAVEEGKKHGISESTIKRSLAKADGTKKPATKPKKPASIKVTLDAGLEAARQHYIQEFAELNHDEQRRESERLIDLLAAAMDGEGGK